MFSRVENRDESAVAFDSENWRDISEMALLLLPFRFRVHIKAKHCFPTASLSHGSFFFEQFKQTVLLLNGKHSNPEESQLNKNAIKLYKKSSHN